MHCQNHVVHELVVYHNSMRFQENAVLKNKNIDLSRENQTLRLELANRSPRRFVGFHFHSVTWISEIHSFSHYRLDRQISCLSVGVVILLITSGSN